MMSWLIAGLLVLRSAPANAAPYETVEISPAGHTRAPLPLHQGVFLTGEASPDAAAVTVVFLRRVGAPFGLGGLRVEDCGDGIQVQESRKHAKELPAAGDLADPETWLTKVPKRSKGFVSTVWKPKPSEEGEATAKAKPAKQAPRFEVFVQDPVFFRPGASYCMVVLQQVPERTSNKKVRQEIEELKQTLQAYLTASATVGLTSAAIQQKQDAFQSTANDIASLMKSADLAATTAQTDDLITAAVDAFVNVPAVRPLYAADASAFDRSQKHTATSPFGKAILSLLTSRTELQLTHENGNFVTQGGDVIESVQLVDDGTKLRLEYQPPPVNNKAQPKKYPVVSLSLRDLRIPPPPAVAGQPQALSVSLLDVLDALEGRLPGTRDPITAAPPGCAEWGYACPKTLEVAATREIAEVLRGVDAVLDRGREDATGGISSSHRDVFEWAKGAFPSRIDDATTITQQGLTKHTLAGMADAYERMVEAGEQWGPLQAKLDALAKTSPRIDRVSVAPVAHQDLDQTTFVSSHVVPVTGLALLFPRRDDAPSLAYYGGMQLYLWPNPVNEPMWTRCRSGTCPDLLRSFALELGLTTTATTKVPANSTLRGVNGSSVIPVIGAALQPLPYLTGTVGVALTGRRPLGLEGERWKTVPVFYLGFSVQANIPGLIRNQMPNSGGTKK